MHTFLHFIYLLVGMIATEPRYTELGITEIAQKLQANLSWLDNAYGRAERLTDSEGKQKPQYYRDGVEYIDLLPDSTKGNFMYFQFEDVQSVKMIAPMATMTHVRMSMVFWWDYREVYEDHENRNVENVKYDIMQVLNSYFQVVNLQVLEFTDSPEDIYRGYDYDLSNQFNRRPYGCLKITCNAQFRATCLGPTSIIRIPLFDYREHKMTFNTDPDQGGDPPIFTILNESAVNFFPIEWSIDGIDLMYGEFNAGITGINVYIKMDSNGAVVKKGYTESSGLIQIAHELPNDGMVGELWIIADN